MSGAAEEPADDPGNGTRAGADERARAVSVTIYDGGDDALTPARPRPTVVIATLPRDLRHDEMIAPGCGVGTNNGWRW